VRKQIAYKYLVVRFKAKTTNKQKKIKEKKIQQRQQSQVNYYKKKQTTVNRPSPFTFHLSSKKTKQIQERLKTDLAV
jgi:hypothetical protein